MNRVLIVDDDREMCELLGECLRREGMEVETVHDGEAGARRAVAGECEVVVLDVMLPGLNGLEVLQRIRAAAAPASRVPVLMLTARGEEMDRVLGLELGADDYLAKPFSPRELIARLRAILRRARPAADDAIVVAVRERLKVGEVEMDIKARAVRRAGEALELTSGEFDLLSVLLRAAGETVTRRELAQNALGRPLMSYDRTIDVHISNLRRKLGPDAAGRERIKTVRGIGYLYALPCDDP